LSLKFVICVDRDPFIYGGPGATGEEAKNLERGPKSPKAGSNESNAQEDLQVLLVGVITMGSSVPLFL
jgi:hypothetical protein